MAAARILLVDDDESFRPAFQKILEKLEYEVVASPNGIDAKKLLEKEKFDLIISDIRMPEMDGIELTRFVKSVSPKTPIILITGLSEILETKTAYDLGADAFLPKPIDRMELSEAIHACLGATPGLGLHPDEGESFCRLSIDDFTTGAQIQFNVFVQLSENKYVKIAHRGEDLSLDRVRLFKTKGLRFLYLRTADFRSYIGFSVALSSAAHASKRISKEKKLNLIKHTGEIIQEQINHQGVDEEAYASAAAFIETTIHVIAEDPNVFALLEILNQQGDHAYAHGVGTSLYGLMMARKVSWHMPANRFKVGLGGLLHDIGEREIPPEILLKGRAAWTKEEIALFETHPKRGAAMLASIHSIPLDVIQIVKQHHESCNGQGFPDRLRKDRIHPMARLIAIASEFCGHVVKTDRNPGISPREAAIRMQALWSDRLDPEFFGALAGLFHFDEATSA